MGRLPDNTFNFASNTESAIPDGNVAKPLIIALLALLASRYLSGGQKDQSAPAGSKPAPKSPEPMPASEPTPDSVLGGLGAFIEQFQQKGFGETIDTWINSGQNKDVRQWCWVRV